jgi:kynurenine formamidase
MPKGSFPSSSRTSANGARIAAPPAHFVKGKRTIDQIELLADLDKVPEAGAIAVVTFPKPKGGSGFPARVACDCAVRARKHDHDESDG